MTLRAKDIMVTQFDKIHIEAPVEHAISMILNGKIRKSGHKTVSLMVLDDFQRLVGVITMFDILYHLRPSFLNFGIDGHELSWDGQTNTYIKELKSKKIHQVMSRNIVGTTSDEHLMSVLDRMVKNRYRRLPVLENGKPIGIVYISDIYYKLFSSE
ncbi:MAG: CBS domain-containing protein [Proteobacteria bacterium]|nr:CBS domain-containing protein [Pseudomonadota bacterium]